MKKLFQLRIDQWLLFGVLVAVGMLFVAKSFLGEGEGQKGNLQKGKTPEELLTERFGSLDKNWEVPVSLAHGQHGIFNARLIVLSPKTGDIGWLDPEKPMDDGITAAWKLKHNFSIEDPDLWSQDPDNDGFNNLEEFIAGTDPLDPQSRPSILVKLRMVKYTYVPFRIQFKAANRLPDGALQFQLNLLDVTKQKTRFVKTGDEIEGYKVGEYRENIVQEIRGGNPIKVDRSELELINVKLNEVVKLILNTEQESDESRVTFRIDVPDAKLVPSDVRRGDNFKLIYMQDGQSAEIEFQLLDGRPDGATIKNIKTGEIKKISIEK